MVGDQSHMKNACHLDVAGRNKEILHDMDCRISVGQERRAVVGDGVGGRQGRTEGWVGRIVVPVGGQ